MVGEKIKISKGEQCLRIKVASGGKCTFHISSNGKKYQQVGDMFMAREGKWIGAKIGFFAMRDGITNDSGSLDIDYIRFN